MTTNRIRRPVRLSLRPTTATTLYAPQPDAEEPEPSNVVDALAAAFAAGDVKNFPKHLRAAREASKRSRASAGKRGGLQAKANRIEKEER